MNRVLRPDSVRRIFDGHVISLVVERWGELEREVVEHPGAVVVVPVTGEGSVVLIRQLRQAVRRELLELPAGTLGPGEDPLAAAERELREETGFHGGHGTAGPSFYTAPGFCRELMHLFFADGVEPGELALEDDEMIEVVPVPAAEIERRLPEIEDAKTLVGLLLYLEARER